MPLEDHAVWPFPPNWSSSVSETLEWLTDISQSPSGSEQRRSRRYFPRKTVDFSIVAWDAERTLLDNLLASYSAGDWYLPVWHEAMVTDAISTFTSIPCAPSLSVRPGSALFIAGTTPFNYQIAEVATVSAGAITLAAPLSQLLPPGTLLHPMTVGRLVEQPALTALTDNGVSAEPQFLITEALPDQGTPPTAEDAGLTDTYRNFSVLTLQPNWTDRSERDMVRLLSEFDNQINTPVRVDTALRPFPTQKLQWVIEGASDHAEFYTMLQFLRGRATALWVPTWMDDMRVASDIAAASTSVTVFLCGFSLAGGPRPERQDILIELLDGRRFYRRIVASTATSTREIIALDQALGEAVPAQNVLRVSFVSLMRLDQDSIQIDHLTDLDGISEVEVTFRSAPDSRVAVSAFGDVA